MDWYYSDGKQQFGPIPETEISQLASAGRINSETLVWHAGLPEWVRYQTVRPTEAYNVAAFDSATATSSGAAAPAAARYCAECGRATNAADMVQLGNSLVCANCKPAVLQRMREGVPVGPVGIGQRVYAGFWIRFAAFIIDAIIQGILQMIIAIPLLATVGLSSVVGGDRTGIAFAGLIPIVYLLQIGVALAYEVMFTVKKGATPGKLAMSLQVVRGEDGSRLNYGLAVGRHFAKWISSLTFIFLGFGFWMAAFDDEKRALHDRICNTRVIRSL